MPITVKEFTRAIQKVKSNCTIDVAIDGYDIWYPIDPRIGLVAYTSCPMAMAIAKEEFLDLLKYLNLLKKEKEDQTLKIGGPSYFGQAKPTLHVVEKMVVKTDDRGFCSIKLYCK